MILRSLHFFLFCVQKIDLTSNCNQNFKKTVSFDDVVHFIDEEIIVTDEGFDCGITFYPETRGRIYIYRSSEKPQCIPSNDQHNCLIDEQHNSKIFLNPYSLWNLVPAALMSLNHTNGRYSITNQYPQSTHHQPRTDSYPVFSSLRGMDSKTKGLRVSFAIFQRSYPPDVRVNEKIATVEELSDL